MNVYVQEDEMCQVFSSKETSKHCYIDYKIFNNKEIIIRENHDGNWNLLRGKKILEELLQKFRPSKIV